MTENCSFYLKIATIVLVWLFRDFAKMYTIVLDTIVLIDCITKKKSHELYFQNTLPWDFQSHGFENPTRGIEKSHDLTLRSHGTENPTSGISESWDWKSHATAYHPSMRGR